MDSEGVKVCGVAVVDDKEFPCVLADQHEGFCDYGPEYEQAVAEG